MIQWPFLDEWPLRAPTSLNDHSYFSSCVPLTRQLPFRVLFLFCCHDVAWTRLVLWYLIHCFCPIHDANPFAMSTHPPSRKMILKGPKPPSKWHGGQANKMSLQTRKGAWCASYRANHAQNSLLNGWRKMSKIVKGCFLTWHKMQRRKNVILALPRVGRLSSIPRLPTTYSQSMKTQGSRMTWRCMGHSTLWRSLRIVLLGEEVFLLLPFKHWFQWISLKVKYWDINTALGKQELDWWLTRLGRTPISRIF